MAYTFDEKFLEYQKIIQENFNVQNPFLLKSGFLGTLANILAFQSVDAYQYYQKVFQEMHPSLATDFNSMLFHASFYGVNIDLAKPATFSVHFQIPIVNTDDVLYYKYLIRKNTQFTDSNGFNFIIPDTIEIIQSKEKIKAYSYSILKGKKELNVIKTTSITGVDIYLVQYDYVQQLKRTFQKIVIPHYEPGTSYYFDINIDNYKNLAGIYAWLNEAPIKNTYDISNFNFYYNSEIAQVFNLKPMNVKYYTFGSSKFDYDIFVDIKESVLSFKTGDGIYGKYLPEGSELYIEIDSSKGEEGNLENIEFIIPDVEIERVNLNKQKTIYNTVLNGFSVTGGSGGMSVEAIESIRNKINDQIRLRNSITTEADFESVFRINDTYPFIDSKFIDSKSIVFIFNALKHNKKVVETTSINVSEFDIANNPFYPEIQYNGKTLISPFYYKKLNNNITQAYIVNPKIDVPLFAPANVDISTYVDNVVYLSIQYDFDTRKSYIVLENTKDDHEYVVTTNQFQVTLNYGNGFKWEVNKIYTDDFCIIKDYLYNFEVNIIDNNGNSVLVLYNHDEVNGKFHQLVLKQEIYKYYIKLPQNNYDIQVSTVATDYLENQLAQILNTVEQFVQPIQDGELAYLLRLPFVSKDFYDNIDYQDFYNLLDSFFSVNENKNKFGLTTQIQQCFYNTIDIPQEWAPYLFEESATIISNPKIPIIINLNIDSQYLLLSEYHDLDTLIFNIKLKIIEYLTQKEGFQVEFFESEIENAIYEEFNAKNKIIKNIELVSPKKFITKNPDQIYYDLINKYDVTEVIKFVPNYFYYDYDNIQVNVSTN